MTEGATWGLVASSAKRRQMTQMTKGEMQRGRRVKGVRMCVRPKEAGKESGISPAHVKRQLVHLRPAEAGATWQEGGEVAAALGQRIRLAGRGHGAGPCGMVY